MVWTGCRNFSHNKYCSNSVIDGVLDIIKCMVYKSFFLDKAWILFEIMSSIV